MIAAALHLQLLTDGLQNLTRELALPKQSGDLIVATLKGVTCLTIVALQLFHVEVLLKLYLLWHETVVYNRIRYE